MINVAMGKPTAQSSSGWSGSSHRAVDGNTDPVYGGSSCTHTQNHPNSWWAVNLQAEFDIVKVILYNREDCCGERLRQLDIYAAPSMPGADAPDVNSGTLCGTFAGPAANGDVVEITCAAGFRGQYIVIQNQNIAEYLTLCEVQVIGLAENIALGKDTLQVNTGWNGDSGRAVDGNADPNYGSQSCTHTLDVYEPWLAIDLGQGYQISNVNLFNRDLCCGTRLRDVLVYTAAEMPTVGTPPSLNNPGSNFCAMFDGPAQNGDVVELTCVQSNVGRYLIIQLAVTEYLTLCEVEVYGVPADLPTPFVAGGGGSADCSSVEEQLATMTAQVGSLQTEKAQCQADLTAAQAQIDNLETTIAALVIDPVIPTASPTAVLSATGFRFSLDLNGIEYILETTPMKISTKSDDFCQQFGMKLAQIENEETLAALSIQLKSIVDNNGVALEEVATGERSAVNLNRDIPWEKLNAAGWSCGTLVPDGDAFKLASKKCDGSRAVLCAAVPLYC